MDILDSTHDRSEQPVMASGVLAVAATFFIDFTHAQYIGKNGRVHIESCCNHCNFRVAEKTSNDFDGEEQSHATYCEGHGAES
ncbi:MAG TPA: hypothetical protein VN577_08225 [Terriglobales bacterium]|nr:hypothetical protein [Terriglobales bacterium]